MGECLRNICFPLGIAEFSLASWLKACPLTKPCNCTVATALSKSEGGRSHSPPRCHPLQELRKQVLFLLRGMCFCLGQSPWESRVVLLSSTVKCVGNHSCKPLCKPTEYLDDTYRERYTMVKSSR